MDVKFIEPDHRHPRSPQALPVHRHRRLHPAAGAADLPRSTRRPPSSSSTTSWPSCPSEWRNPDRQRSRVPVRVPLARRRPGIGHTYIRPGTPRLNGKVERSHRIDAEEFYRLLSGAVIDDAGVFNDKLQQWEDYYNYQRPHGGLDGQTPYERLLQKTQTEPVTDDHQLHICGR